MSPKLLNMVKDKEITKEQISNDIKSGMIVAIIALPLSVALAISSGLSPEKGLITAIIAGIVISVLGGSKVQIGGPTAAFAVIVYGVVEQHGVSGLITSTIIAGILLIIMGLLKVGTLIKHVPKTVTVGFTAGIAISLLISQFKDFFGFEILKMPAKSMDKIGTYIHNIETFDITSLIVGLLCILIMVYWPKINKSVPGSVIALVAATVLVSILNIGIDTIGNTYSNISSSIPMPTLPKIDISNISKLIQPSFTIAVLVGIQALLSCAVSDEMIGESHDSNTELIAQGFGNIASGLFGGMPATGAVARTISNVKNNGRSPIAGIAHCLTLLFIMVFMMPFMKMIPLTVLSSILIVVSFNMGDWNAIRETLKGNIGDILVLFSTFILTITFDIIVAIIVGMTIHLVFNAINKKQTEIPDFETEKAV